MSNKGWQDAVTLVAGMWLAVVPWVLGHDESNALVLFNFVGVGVALVLFSAGALSKPEAWEEVIDFLVGLWAIASPWLLGFSNVRDLTINAVVVGLLVAVLSAWTAMARSRVIERWRQHGPV